MKKTPRLHPQHVCCNGQVLTAVRGQPFRVRLSAAMNCAFLSIDQVAATTSSTNHEIGQKYISVIFQGMNNEWLNNEKYTKKLKLLRMQGIRKHYWLKIILNIFCEENNSTKSHWFICSCFPGVGIKLFPDLELNNYLFSEEVMITWLILAFTVWIILFKFFTNSRPGVSYKVKLHDTTVTMHYNTAVGDFLSFFFFFWNSERYALEGERKSQSSFDQNERLYSSERLERRAFEAISFTCN